MSGGVGLIDYDGDGWLDVYCVQGGPLNSASGPPGQAVDQKDRLFRNRGDGTFQDVTAETGLQVLLQERGYGLGVAVGDYDNDGLPDLLLTRLRSYVLLRNRDGRTFEDVTELAGLAGPRDNPTSAAFADLDNDGRVDALILAQNEPLAYFHNLTENPGHFVTLRLEGTRSNRDGVGARVTVVAGRHRRVAHRLGGGSYQSANESRLILYASSAQKQPPWTWMPMQKKKA